MSKKDIDVIGNILQNTASIESRLGRFIVGSSDSTAPCIVFGNMPKEQVNLQTTKNR